MSAGKMATLVQVCLLLGCVSALAAAPIDGGESGEPEVLEALFSKALRAEGQAYAEAREAICAKEASARKLLAEKRKAPETWQEALLAEILLEYLDRKGKPNPLLKLEPNLYHSRGWQRTRYCAQYLAGEGREVPMFLAESLWKGNKLNEKRWMKHEPKPTLVLALGLLRREKRARALLEEHLFLLQEEPRGMSYRIKQAAAQALARIGSDNSVPALLRASVSTEHGTDMAAALAIEALASCVSKETLPQIKEFAEDTKDEVLKGALKMIIDEFEAPTGERKGKLPTRDRSAKRQSGPEEVSIAPPLWAWLLAGGGALALILAAVLYLRARRLAAG